VFWVCTIVVWDDADTIRYFGNAASNNVVKVEGHCTIRHCLVTVGKMRKGIIVVDDMDVHPSVGPEDVETKGLE
jgi:hypothetical protein